MWGLFIFNVIIILFYCMKRDPYAEGTSFKPSLFTDREKNFQTIPHTARLAQYTTGEGFPINSSANKQPIPLFNKFFSEEFKPEPQKYKLVAKRKSQTNLNPEGQKPKSNSAYQKSDKTDKLSSKYDYLQFIQNHGKKSRQKLHNDDMKSSFISVQPYEQQNQKMQTELKKIKQNMERYYYELQKKDELIAKKQKEIMQKNGKMNKLFQEIERLMNKQKEYENALIDYNLMLQKSKRDETLEMSYYELSEKYNEVVAQLNSKLDKERSIVEIHERLTYLEQKCLDYENKEIYYSNLQQDFNQVSDQVKHLQFIVQKKEEMLQNTITSKNNEYKSIIAFKNNEIKALQNRSEILQRQNVALNTQINDLELHSNNLEYQLNRLQYERSIENCSHEEHQQNNKADGHSLSQLGAEFQQKVNHYINENMRLQNLLNKGEGQLQTYKREKESLSKMVEAYEQRDQMSTQSETNEEFKYLRDKLEAQKEQKDKLVSRFELQILKLQNIIQKNKFDQKESLLDIYDQQKLREGLFFALNDVEKLKSKLQKWQL